MRIKFNCTQLYVYLSQPTNYTLSATPVRVVGSRILRVCRRVVLKPRSTVEGGDESVKDRARGQAQAKGWRRPLARSFTGSARPSVTKSTMLLGSFRQLARARSIKTPPDHNRVESKAVAVFLSPQVTPGPLNPHPTPLRRPPRWLTPPPAMCR